MTTVYINGKFVAQPTTGVQRFARELIVATDRLLSTGHWRSHAELVLLVPSGRVIEPIPSLHHIRVKELPAERLHIWEQLKLPLASRGSLLVNLAGSAPLFKRQQICTFHDAAVFDVSNAYSAAFGHWYRFLFRVQSSICRRILTVSEFSKQRLCHHLNLPESAIGVVPNGADHVTHLSQDDSVIEKFSLMRRRYLLAVGSNNPSKNFSMLMAAFGRVRYKNDISLVVVGGGNNAVFASGESNSGIDSSIVQVGRVTDGQLASLYAHARAFVFPSIYEGFGIPPLEAMSFGCPVLAARSASIPEVCGEAAVYFDPNDVDDVARMLEVVISDEQDLDGLIMAGYARVSQFTWDQAARHFLSELAVLGVVSQTSSCFS
jgi:glycosyltransferase involved in cell wall biosynthesis